MNTDWKSLPRIAAVLLLGLVLAGCASGPNSAPSPELLQRIEAARSRGDHEALVKYYEGEAVASRARAIEHRKMGKSYQGVMSSGKGGGSNMPAHCNSIVNLYESIATEYDGLAGDHRQMAKSASL